MRELYVYQKVEIPILAGKYNVSQSLVVKILKGERRGDCGGPTVRSVRKPPQPRKPRVKKPRPAVAVKAVAKPAAPKKPRKPPRVGTRTPARVTNSRPKLAGNRRSGDVVECPTCLNGRRKAPSRCGLCSGRGFIRAVK